MREYARYFDMQDIEMAYHKAKKNLAENISGSTIPGSRLVKVYMTTTTMAGRSVWLCIVGKDTYIPIILRPKTDKKIGENMSVSNPAFEKLLDKTLDAIMDDIKAGRYKSLDI